MKQLYNRIKTTLLILMLCMCSISANAQKHNKYSDSYNFRKGIEALDANDAVGAEASFTKELEEHPDNGYAYLYLSHVHSYNEEYGRALSSINNALQLISKKDKSYKGLCHYERGGIYKALGKYNEAIADFTQAISYDSSNEDYYWERAQIYFEQGKYELADADYKAMHQIDENAPLPYMGLGRNEAARKNYLNAIDLYDTVIALYSDYASGYSFRAEAYMGLGRYMEAASDIIKALELNYDNKAFGLMIEIADSAFVQINTKLKAKAVTDPNNSYWPYCIGVINERTKKYQDAITNYLKSSKLNEDAMTYNRISTCYVDMGEWASAIEYLDKAIALEPKYNDYVLYKAEIYYEAGQFETAIEIIDQYIETVPDYYVGYHSRAWYKEHVNDYDGALEDYTTATTLNPEDSAPIMARGNLYLLKGETELARKDFERVIQIDTIPENGSRTMYALMRLGRNEEAIDWMNKMLESSDDEGVRYEAACLYSLMGDSDKSLSYLEESLKGGNKSYSHIMTDNDLINIRDLDSFNVLMEKYFPNEVKANLSNKAFIEYKEHVAEVPFTRQGGVTQVKCSVNGLPLHFIFDTGAADVTISRVEATFMFKNGYLSSDDIIGKARYMDANGDISIGTVINIKKITFGDQELENVRASVVESNNAPLLLGQSVLNRLGRIEIDYDRSMLKITSKEKIILSNVSGEHNGYKYVDLGLSVLWATCNLGASSPEGYGDYYAWGETSTKSSYVDGTSKTFNHPIKDISGNPYYDAAYSNWGGGWRMPTKAEFQELIDNCTWTWYSIEGKRGYIVTSNKNGNCIFLPAAGFRNTTELVAGDERGAYWTSTHHEKWANYVNHVELDSNEYLFVPLGPCFGLTIRPVLSPDFK
jgi:clan AA aspartic protease (TIGR02281 family)